MKHEAQVDTMLAELYRIKADLSTRIGWHLSTIHHLAGDKKNYRGRSGAFDWQMLDAQAEAVLAGKLERGEIKPWDERNATKAIKGLEAVRSDLDWIAEQIAELSAWYTGWARFFLVTSSSGHVHSSMACHTCYPRTTYGWLPHLSGESEHEAVAELGPALCSVCFASAPVDMQGGKITKAEAERRSA